MLAALEVALSVAGEGAVSRFDPGFRPLPIGSVIAPANAPEAHYRIPVFAGAFCCYHYVFAVSPLVHFCCSLS